MLTGRLIGPLNQLVGQWRAFNNFKQSVERLGDVFNMESERTESEITGILTRHDVIQAMAQ